MCEPVTLTIATTLAVAGAAASAYSQYRQAQYQQALGERNAKMADVAAADALSRGQAQAGKLAMHGSEVIGAQRAAAGASGVDVTSGAPVGAERRTGLLSAIDVETAKNNAAREAWGYKVQGVNYQAQAQAAGEAGTYALIGGGLSLAGTALGGAARTYKSYKMTKEDDKFGKIG